LGEILQWSTRRRNKNYNGDKDRYRCNMRVTLGETSS